MMRRTFGLLGALLLTVGLAVPTTADTSQFLADDVVTLANEVSSAMVPAGAAETAVLIAADDDLAFAAPSLLGALPLHVPLLVTEAGELSAGVLDELDRATGRDESATVHVVGAATSPATAELEAAGYAVIPFDGTDATALATSAAGSLYGTPAGTSQRVIIVPAGNEVLAGIASALGIWLAIPVIPVTADGFATDAFIREIWAIGDFGGATPQVTTPGPGTLRTFGADDLFTLALELDELAAAELGDTAPPTVVTHAPVVVSITGDTTPALVAATVSARRSLDGDRAPLLLVEGEFDTDFAARCDVAAADAPTWCQLAAADGDVTFVGLTTLAGDVADDARPLPATGGSMAVLGVLLLGMAIFRRSS